MASTPKPMDTAVLPVAACNTFLPSSRRSAGPTTGKGALLLAYHAWWILGILPALWQVDARLALSWMIPTAWCILLIVGNLADHPRSWSTHNVVRGFVGEWIRRTLCSDAVGVPILERARSRLDRSLGVNAENA